MYDPAVSTELAIPEASHRAEVEDPAQLALDLGSMTLLAIFNTLDDSTIDPNKRLDLARRVIATMAGEIVAKDAENVSLTATVGFLTVENDNLRYESLTDQQTEIENRRGLEKAFELRISKRAAESEMRTLLLQRGAELQTADPDEAEELFAEAAAIKVTPGWGGGLLIDIDNFKLLNDKLGHLMGDEIMRELSLEYCNSVRMPDDDVVGRYGKGDEIMVLFAKSYGTRRGDVTRMMQSIPKRFEQRARVYFQRKFDELSQNPKYAGVDFKLLGEKVGVSIGAVRYEKDMSFNELAEKADMLMYKIKEAKKAETLDDPNQFALFEPAEVAQTPTVDSRS